MATKAKKKPAKKSGSLKLEIEEIIRKRISFPCTLHQDTDTSSMSTKEGYLYLFGKSDELFFNVECSTVLIDRSQLEGLLKALLKGEPELKVDPQSIHKSLYVLEKENEYNFDEYQWYYGLNNISFSNQKIGDVVGPSEMNWSERALTATISNTKTFVTFDIYVEGYTYGVKVSVKVLKELLNLTK